MVIMMAIGYALAALLLLAPTVFAAAPALTIHNATWSSISNGESFIMHQNSAGYTFSMLYNGKELVNTAVGGYSDTGGKLTLNFTYGNPTVVQQTENMIDVAYEAYEATVHYVLFTGVSGFYHYNVVKNLGQQGEVRSLYRLDPIQFTHGRTNIKNGPLPLIQDIKSGYKVQDETWQRSNGSYITKYDFSCFVRDLDFHGVYGEDVGAWIIAPGKDYYIGDQLKQELMLHRESSTNDAVLLHMYHGNMTRLQVGRRIMLTRRCRQSLQFRVLQSYPLRENVRTMAFVHERWRLGRRSLTSQTRI